MYELLLVSNSPRRKQILEDAGFLFRIDTVKVSETIEENVNLVEAIRKIAQTKAQAYIDDHKRLKSKDILIVTADTMVVLGGRAFGKPKNEAHAAEFLRELSEKKHSVITALCFKNLKSGEEVVTHDETLVEFKNLSESEIQDYIRTGEPADKAGAYAIQGIAKKFIKNIYGSYTNVVGLPIELFEKVLIEKKWMVARTHQQ
jgi:septum formation protein